MSRRPPLTDDARARAADEAARRVRATLDAERDRERATSTDRPRRKRGLEPA